MAIRKSSISRTPSGNTASRPADPEIGATYNNGTLGVEEIYTASGWVAKSAPASVPINVVATNQGSGRAFNNGQASVAFSNGEGGGLVVDYIVTPSPATSPATFTGSSSPITVTGLQSSQEYTYTLQARNNFGTSLSSAASTGVTATTVPQAPTIGTATGGNAQASVTFTANATGGSAITSYTVTSSPGNITASGASSPITVTGLTNDTAYTFTVTATNANGISAASAASNSVTPFDGVTVDYLVIAGGGGGNGGQAAQFAGAGGGAGTARTSNFAAAFSTNYSVQVGAGGAGGPFNTGKGGDGTSSIFATVTATGGIGPAFNSRTGGGNADYVGGTTTGNPAGAGAGSAQNGSTIYGGDGIVSSISGTSVTRGGGGGVNGGTPGAGGGGIGRAGGSAGGAGETNTGSGGGGAGDGYNGGAGGSGIVILRYTAARTITLGAGLTGSTSTVGENKVTTITAGTGTISFS